MLQRIALDGWTLEYEFSRKRVKNLNLRVRSDGTVAVSAPLRMPTSATTTSPASNNEPIMNPKRPGLRGAFSVKNHPRR